MYEIELFFKNYDMDTKHRTDYLCTKNVGTECFHFFF